MKRAAEVESASPVKSAKVAKADGLGWQATKYTMQEKLAHICNSELYADVHFVVGRAKQRFSAHKVVLSVGSIVFARMLGADWLKDEDIEVPDIEPAPFSAILKFLYYDHVAIFANTASEVLYAARKYAIPVLENSCVDFIIKNTLCSSNVFSILLEAKFYELPKLIDSCLEVLDYEMEEAVQGDGAFLNINLDTLCSILRRNFLTINESDLLCATLRWAAAECSRQDLKLNAENQLSVLKNALYLIRFPLISLDQFAARMEKSKLLTDKELASTLMCFINKKGPTSFSSYSRLSSYVVARRFQFSIASPFLCNDSQETVSFHADRAINLAGVVFYGPQKDAGDYSLSIGIYDCANRRYLSNTSKWTFQKISTKFRLWYNPVLKLVAKNTYRIEFALKGPPTIQGSEALNEVFARKSGLQNEKIKVTFVGSNPSKRLSDLLFQL